MCCVDNFLSRQQEREYTQPESGPDPMPDTSALPSITDLLTELTTLRARAAAAEEALLQSTDMLSSLVSALPVGVVTIDRAGRVALWNRAAEAILGYTAEEMIGQPLPTKVFSMKNGVTGAAHVYLRMVTGQVIKGEEVRYRRKDGSFVETSFSGAGLMDEDGRLRCAICVFEDIGLRKAITHQLHQAQKMEAVGQLTGGMAHDFNNILGVAIGNLDLLAAEIADRPAAAELAEIAVNALLRGAELTRALLAFSRRQPLQPARLDAAALLSGVTRMLSRVLGEQIHVQFRAKGDLWPVLADPAQLEAAITNLAINARDAMPHGGRLTVTGCNTQLCPDELATDGEPAAGDYLLIEVADTGAGMTAAVLARAFEPFFTTKPVGQGTGLGLSMVYGFIKQSGGTVKIDSVPGRGTVVRLYLPRANNTPDAASGPVDGGEEVTGGNETILVVEDNPDVRRLAEGMLSGLGYRVLTAEHGPAALALLDSGVAVDLLFTDVVMPEGLTGYDLAEEALRRRPGLKVLFTSGYPGTTPPPPACLSGRLLCKPYRFHDLGLRVRESLDSNGANP